MGYLSHPNKRDKEILAFADSATFDVGELHVYTEPLGFYDHCADEYQMLIVSADKELVNRICALCRAAYDRGPRRKRKWSYDEH